MAIFQPSAYYNRANISTNDLNLYLDASKTTSYPNTGSIWFDLSGNNKSATLTNGPTFGSKGGGSFTFDGINDYATTTVVLQAPTNETVQSFSGWLIGDGSLFGSSASGSGQFHLKISLSGTTLSYFVTRFGGAAGEINNSASIDNKNEVANLITVVKTSAEKYDVYVNAKKFMDQVTKKANVNTMFWPGQFYNNEFFSGSVGEYLFYNRALTQDEITHNYNATRTRFGV